MGKIIMDFKNIKKIKFEDRIYKVLRVSIENADFLVVSNDIVSHMSFKFVEQEIANGRADIE